MHQQPATGYPYPYPPHLNPPQQPPSAAANGYPTASVYTYQNHNPYYTPYLNPRDIRLRRAFITFVTIVLILLLISFICITVLRPDSPDVYITSLSVSNFNVTTNKVSGIWDLTLQFRNPNSKTSLRYSSGGCTLYYRREILADTRFQPFEQGKKDQTPINATLSASGSYIDDRAAESIGKERLEKGKLEFDVKVVSLFSFQFGAFRRSRYLSVYCDDVAVRFPASDSSGKMILSSKRCNLY